MSSLFSVNSNMAGNSGCLTLYHGSPSEVVQPLLSKCKPKNDYGVAFYCTPKFELGAEWAVTSTSDGVCNEYLIDLTNLNVLYLDKKDTLSWVAITSKFRGVNISEFDDNAIYLKVLMEKYFIDLTPYDVIVGYRADDRFFDFIKRFVDNNMTIDRLEFSISNGGLGLQYALRTQKALDAIKFVKSEKVKSSVYSKKKISRDKMALRRYNESGSNIGIGKRMYQILEEKHNEAFR